MTVNYVKTQSIGESGQSPKIVYIDTNDTLATVTTAGFLNKIAKQYALAEGDAILITTTATPTTRQKQLSLLDVTFLNGNWSLITMTAPSTVASVTGTAGEIIATGATNVVISIDPNYPGSLNITAVGTITSGTWNGSTITVPYGGTGTTAFTPYSVVLGGSTSTSNLQSVATLGASGQVLTSQGASAVPIWTTIAGAGDMILAAVQTNTGAKTFDANTFILAGSTSGTITVNAAAVAGTQTIVMPAQSGTIALTSDIPADPVPLVNGGTNAALVASNGGVFYSTATAGAILAGTATAGQMLRSGATAAPTWSTATFPNSAGNTGRVLRADGTNWVESTSTYGDVYTANDILFASSTNAVSGLSTINDAVLISGATGIPSFSTTLPAGVLSNITTLGTVTTGTWNADTITVPYGGTGNTTFTAYSVILAGATAQGAFQNAVGLGTSGQVLTSAGAGAAPAWATPGTGGAVATVVGTANRIDVDSTDAANPIVNIDTAYVGQASITTLGTIATGVWSATDVALAAGGTNASLTADDGAIVYSTATAMALLAATATASKVLMSGSNAAPIWSTPTYPSGSGAAGKVVRADGTNNVYSTSTFADTYAASSLLYSNGANTVTGLAKVNNAALVSSAAGVPAWEALTDGEIIIGSAAGVPIAANITGGTGITVVDGNNSITISTTATGTTWSEIVGTTQAAAINNGYIVGNVAQTTITLPATAAVGSEVQIVGKGAGGWILSANTGDTIINGDDETVAGGNLTAANAHNSIRVICITANTTWTVVSTYSTGITVEV